MRTKLSKILLAVILCFSLVPLAGLSLAWADDDTEQGIDDTLEGYDGLEGEEGEEGDGLDGGDLGEDDLSLAASEPELVPLATEEGEELTTLADTYTLSYRSHVQNIGWQPWVTDGTTSGTVGRGLRMEAVNISLSGSGLTGSIEYRTHVQNIGWMDWVSDGELSGTTGRSLRVEAISIRLTDGTLKDTYDIYYRVHVQNYGWLGWATDGMDAGSAGYGYRMEAIEIRLLEKGDPAAPVAGNAFRKPAMALSGRGHVQDIGWQGWSGAVPGNILTIGTTGRSLRVEALCLQVLNSDYPGSVEYRAHVQNIGWQGWVGNGAVAGTTGRGYQVEAIQIRLTGALDANFDVYYRAHIPNIGWLGWTTDGGAAGTAGFSCRIEALQVVLVAKHGGAPGSMDNPYLSVSYTSEANVASLDWMTPVTGRGVTGTTGRGLRMEAYKLTVSSDIAGSIEYRALVQDEGWQAWAQDGGLAGTLGEDKRIEAIQVRLTGDLARYFDVYYRAHSANWGWLGWARNGASAGTGKVGYALEAFELVFVVKGTAAPGTTGGAYWETPPIPPTYRAMNDRAASQYSPTGWLIVIDTYNCLFGVYSGSQGNWTNRSMWLCSPGTWATPTIKGVYHVGSKGYVFGSGYSCYWYTQIYGDYLIHSVLYYPGTNTIMEGTMGVPGSHGCVRLDIQNAKWIYDNVPTGSTILIY